MGYQCCVMSCKKTSKEVLLHRFPTNTELCKKWVEAVNRPDFKSMELSKIRKQFRLCHDHFPSSQRLDFLVSTYGRGLIAFPIPSINLDSPGTVEEQNQIIIDGENIQNEEIQIQYEEEIPTELEEEIPTELEEEISTELEEEIDEDNSQNWNHNENILKEELEDMRKKMEEISKNLEEKEEQIKRLNALNILWNDRSFKLNQENEILIREIENLKKISRWNENSLKSELENKNVHITISNNQINTLNNQIEMLTKEISSLKKVIDTQSESNESEHLVPLDTIDIFDATRKGCLDAIKYWIKNQPFYDFQDYTPLHYAAEGGSQDILEFFVKNKREFKKMLEFKNKNGETPLLCATRTNNLLPIINILVENGANIESIDNNNNKPLHWACSNGNLLVSEYLISKGANIESITKGGYTALHYAVINSRFPIIKLLIHRGANINARGGNGNTPLHYAYKNKNENIIQFLIENCANPNILNCDGKYPGF